MNRMQRRRFQRHLFKRLPKPMQRRIRLEQKAGVTVEYVRERGAVILARDPEPTWPDPSKPGGGL